MVIAAYTGGETLHGDTGATKGAGSIFVEHVDLKTCHVMPNQSCEKVGFEDSSEVDRDEKRAGVMAGSTTNQSSDGVELDSLELGTETPEAPLSARVGSGFMFVRDLTGSTVVVSCRPDSTIAEVCAAAARRSKDKQHELCSLERGEAAFRGVSCHDMSNRSTKESSICDSPPPSLDGNLLVETKCLHTATKVVKASAREHTSRNYSKKSSATRQHLSPPSNKDNDDDDDDDVELRLQWGGKLLEPGLTLRDYGIAAGSTLEMTMPLRGGIDGMTIMAFAILGAVALYLLYKLVLLIIKFGRWLWRFILRAPVCWCNKNMCYPVCQTCRFAVYTCKESCCALCDCCDLHYHPWKRMEITS